VTFILIEICPCFRHFFL